MAASRFQASQLHVVGLCLGGRKEEGGSSLAYVIVPN